MSKLATADLLTLSLPERIQLEDLWDSIAMESESLPFTEEQRMELDRRLEEYQSDPSAGSPWATVMERLRNEVMRQLFIPPAAEAEMEHLVPEHLVPGLQSCKVGWS